MNQSEETFSYLHDYLLFTQQVSVTLSSMDSQLAEWRFIFDIILMSLLFILLLFTLILIFFKQKNVPVSQSIEVDPREPHSITITFVPANVMQANNALISGGINSNNNQNANTNQNIAASNRASDAPEMTQTPGSVLTNHDSHTATIA